jgi:F-type H+-transporting ATPase subunit b
MIVHSLQSLAPPTRPASAPRPSRAIARETIRGLWLLAILTTALSLASAASIGAQGHEAPPAPSAHAQPPAAEHGATEETHEEGGGLLHTIAKLTNFLILVGVLVYYLKSPIAAYLVGRSTHIRQDLIAAADTRAAATKQLDDIKRKLQTLPGELAALKAQGEADVKAERVRLAQVASIERERLLGQTRREIDTRFRVARRELIELTAQLAVTVARDRISRSITPEDQMRLVDRYTSQVGQAL